jgi:hypothetical protein
MIFHCSQAQISQRKLKNSHQQLARNLTNQIKNQSHQKKKQRELKRLVSCATLEKLQMPWIII